MWTRYTDSLTSQTTIYTLFRCYDPFLSIKLYNKLKLRLGAFSWGHALFPNVQRWERSAAERSEKYNVTWSGGVAIWIHISIDRSFRSFSRTQISNTNAFVFET